MKTNGGFVGIPQYSGAKNGPGTWTSEDVFLALANRKRSTYPAYNAWPKGPDPSFASLALLCHCDKPRPAALNAGVDSTVGSTGQSQRANTGLTGIETGLSMATAKWGSTCVFTSGKTGQGFYFTQSATEFTFGTGDFTIEWWHNMPNTNVNQNLFDPRTSASQAVPLVYFDASSKMRYFVSGADKILGVTAVSINTWHFGAVSRLSGTTYLYLDGGLEGSFADATNYNVTTANWYFGGQNISGAQGGGAANYLQDIRITKGVGRYSGSTCPVPTDPFPDYGP